MWLSCGSLMPSRNFPSLPHTQNGSKDLQSSSVVGQMQAVALHVLQHSRAELSATSFSPADNIDCSSHLDILCLHKTLLSRNL